MTLNVVQVIGDAAVGGAERHVLNLSQHLREHGISVRVICPRPGPLTKACEAARLPVECIEMNYLDSAQDYLFNASAYRALLARFKPLPDVVHSHLHTANLHATVAATAAGVPAILNTAHTLKEARVGDALLARTTSLHFVAVAKVMASALERAGVPSDRITVIRNGIPVPERATTAYSDASEKVLVGVASRLSYEKGIDVLIKAIHVVASRIPQIYLAVAGEGLEGPALRDSAKELGIASKISFIGTTNDVSSFLASCDLYVSPSRSETISFALLEAMAAGLPVIATRVGGSSEVIENGVSGLMVANEDHHAIAEAIERLVIDRNWRSKLGQAARKRIESQFTLQAMAERTTALYGRLLDLSRTSGVCRTSLHT